MPGWAEGYVAAGGAGMVGLEKTEGQDRQGLDDKWGSTELLMLTTRVSSLLA